jgi:mercuric ion binding protein
MLRFIAPVIVAVSLLGGPDAALAANISTVLTVHHAGCVLCAPIVKSTLERVNGVSSVQVSQADGNADVTATIEYDDALVTPDALIKATTDQGYPAEIKS